MSVPELEANVILETAFVGKYIKRIIAKTGLNMRGESGPVVAIDKMRCDRIGNISVNDATERNSSLTDEHAKVVSQVTKRFAMSDSMIRAKTYCRGIPLMWRQENLSKKPVAFLTKS